MQEVKPLSLDLSHVNLMHGLLGIVRSAFLIVIALIVLGLAAKRFLRNRSVVLKTE